MIEEVGEEMTDEEAPRFGRTIDAEEIDAEEIDETTKDEEIPVLMVVVTRDGKILTSP